jgi:hypothetical protein
VSLGSRLARTGVCDLHDLKLTAVIEENTYEESFGLFSGDSTWIS